MDLMKELIEERKEPHTEDIGSWRGKTLDALDELKKAVDSIRGEDLDSDYYSKSRAVKVTKFLKEYIDNIQKDVKKMKAMS